MINPVLASSVLFRN